MACNESDDKRELQNEIRKLEEQLADLDGKLYEICIQKKFIRHRINDLEYQLATGIDPRSYNYSFYED